MPFNGSGVFTRIYTWVNDAASGIKIRADRMDNEFDGIATGLSNCLTKDGQTTPTGDLPMGGQVHTNVGNGATRTNYPSVGQVMDGGLLYASTVGGDGDAITLTFSPAITALVEGMNLSFTVGSNNTTAVTIAVNGLTAVSLVKNGSTALVADDIQSGDVVTIQYDGTSFQLTSPLRAEAIANEQVLISSNDTTKGYLDDKIALSAELNSSITNPGANEVLTINPVIASQAEAEAGTNNNKLVTPLRVAEAITALTPTPDVGAGIGALGTDVVGSLVFAEATSGGPYVLGDTISGGNLATASASLDDPSAPTLTGTWTCLGYSSGSGPSAATLWKKTAA